MKLKLNLFIKSNGEVRVTKRHTGFYQDEIYLKLELNVPDALFKRPIINAAVDSLYKNQVSNDKYLEALELRESGYTVSMIGEVLELKSTTVQHILLRSKKSKDGNFERYKSA